MYRFSNNATATLAVGITDVATAIGLSAGHGARFPAAGGDNVFAVTLVDAANNVEIALCTSRAGDTLTLLRGQEGTTARAYIAGDRVELRLTKAVLETFLQNTGDQTVDGDITADAFHGPADTANRWTTTRTLSFTGAATGSNTVNGSGNVAFSLTLSDAVVTTPKLADDSVTNAKLAEMASMTVKGRIAGGTGNPADLTVSDLNVMMGRVGTLVVATGATAPTGAVIATGQLLNRVTYANLWAYAQASGNLAASDGVWTAGKYSPGDGSTTFRIPNLGGYFIRALDLGAGIDPGRLIGTIQAGALEAHTHALGGSFRPVGTGSGFSGTSGLSSSTVTATQSSGGTETRPKNIAYPVCIWF